MAAIATPSTSATGSARIPGLELGRLVCAYLVVLLHVIPATNVALMSVCRVAVPYFLMLSGYLAFPTAAVDLDRLTRRLARLVIAYIAWVALYVVAFTAPASLTLGVLLEQLHQPNVAYHLWFLPALGVSLLVTGMAVHLGMLRVAVALATVAAVVAIANGTYHDVLGLSGSAKRGGLLAAPLCVMLGAVVRRSPFGFNLHIALLGSVVLYNVLVIEELLVGRSLPVAFGHDFAVATIPLTFCVFIAFLKVRVPDKANRLLSLGRLTFGIYLVHLGLLELLIKSLQLQLPITGVLAFPIALIVFVAAAVISSLMGAYSLTRFLVR